MSTGIFAPTTRRASTVGARGGVYGRCVHNCRMTTAACPPPGSEPGDGRNRRRQRHLNRIPTKTRGDYLDSTRLGGPRPSMPGHRHAEHCTPCGGDPVMLDDVMPSLDRGHESSWSA